jgi:S1-C subfamily serine protease
MTNINKIIPYAVIFSLACSEPHKAIETSISNGNEDLEGKLISINEPNDYNGLNIGQEQINTMLSSVGKFYQKSKVHVNVFSGNQKIEELDLKSAGWGSGLVFKNKGKYYVITCEHVTSPVEDRTEKITFGPIQAKIEYKVKDTKSLVYIGKMGFKYKQISLDKTKDLSLLELDVPNLINPPYFKGEMARSLSYGNISYVVGFPDDFGKTITQGIISQPENKDKMNKYFLSTAPINSGNSGGPLYIIRGGQPVFAGISQITYPELQGIHRFIHTDEIRDFLKKGGINEFDR